MPPKPKFTREEIIDAALELVSEKGMEGLTSRDLGAKLGSSARPIFTVFKNMEEVQQEVLRAAMKKFENYARKALYCTPAFKQVGIQMILFAMEEPRLYRLLFMEGNGAAKNFEQVFDELGETAVVCVETIQKDYGLDAAGAKALFEHVWIFTFGIGALCAMDRCRFSQEEINELLGQDFAAMLMRIKAQ
ncbi:MAG: TetR family transcriptional regulator [Clostridiales bacterium]|nr:TetR family transcriptional regulator [Clostridiales bacterium]